MLRTLVDTVVDTALDRTIAPGWSRLGLEVRRRLPGWPADPSRMDGKVVLVTGAGGGLGRAAAEGFARLGARVLVVTRSAERSEEACAALRLAVGPGADLRPVACDVSSLQSVRACAADLIATEERLDVLVHNAGLMPPERSTSPDGIELALATHVLGPFELTRLLDGLLRTSAPARVITVVSGGMYAHRLDVDDLQSERGPYRGAAVYARTKRAALVLTGLWAERFAGSGVVAHAMHPGWADTPGIRSSLPGFFKLTRPILRDAADGADTVIWLGGAPEPLTTNGKLWQDRAVRPEHLLPRTRETSDERARLWAELEDLAGPPTS